MDSRQINNHIDTGHLSPHGDTCAQLQEKKKIHQKFHHAEISMRIESSGIKTFHFYELMEGLGNGVVSTFITWWSRKRLSRPLHHMAKIRSFRDNCSKWKITRRGKLRSKWCKVSSPGKMRPNKKTWTWRGRKARLDLVAWVSTRLE